MGLKLYLLIIFNKLKTRFRKCLGGFLKIVETKSPPLLVPMIITYTAIIGYKISLYIAK